ncbi:MAG: YidB family protein [Acidimicrobiia bacterium]
MGLLDGLLGSVLKKKKGGIKSGSPLLDALLPLLAGGAASGALGNIGGLGGLLGKFTGAGMGDKAQSWVSTGQNEALEPHEVEQALGGDAVGQLAAETGMSHDQVKGGLASMLPGLIDQLTPGGKMPDAGGLASLTKGLDLGKLLGK